MSRDYKYNDFKLTSISETENKNWRVSFEGCVKDEDRYNNNYTFVLEPDPSLIVGKYYRMEFIYDYALNGDESESQ